MEAAVAPQPPPAGRGAPRAGPLKRIFPNGGLGAEPAPPPGQEAPGLRGIRGGAAELGGGRGGGAGPLPQGALAALSLRPGDVASSRRLWRRLGAPPPPLLVVQGQGVQCAQSLCPFLLLLLLLPRPLHLLGVRPPASPPDSSCVRVRVAEGEHRVQAAAERLGPGLVPSLPPAEPGRAGEGVQLVLQTVVGGVCLRVEPVCGRAARGRKRSLYLVN